MSQVSLTINILVTSHHVLYQRRAGDIVLLISVL